MDLSIIIPAYNMQGYIASCLRSVTRCPNFENDNKNVSLKNAIRMECIVVDDGSTDETAEIVNRYMQRDSRIKLVRKENGGVSDTRNRGILEAIGKYVMFLDADDMLCEDAWEQIIPIVKNEYADFSAFSYITLYENGKMKPQMLPIEDIVSTDINEARRLIYADSVFNTCWGKLFRKDIIIENNIQFRKELPIGEDFLFVAEYFSHCKNVFMSKAMIVYYLQRGGSAMRSYSMDKRLSYTQVLYEYNLNTVQQLQDDLLQKQMNVYYVKVLTNLFYEYAKLYKKDELKKIYEKAIEMPVVAEIINSAKKNDIESAYKRFEYGLLLKGNINSICIYFLIKAKL